MLQPNKDIKRRERTSSTSKMHEFPTLNWFKKRFPASTKESYLYSTEELQHISMATEVFMDYDQDNSGSLEVEEVYSMFQHNEINISRKKLSYLFNIIHTKQKNKLNLEEFKELTFSSRANNYFKEIMRDAKKELQSKGKMFRPLPLDFKDMLRVLYDRRRHKKCLDQIDLNNVQNDFQMFKSAFNMNTNLSSTHAYTYKIDTQAHRTFIHDILAISIPTDPEQLDHKIPHINSKSTNFSVTSPEPLSYKPTTKLHIPETLKHKLVQAHVIGVSAAEDEILAQLLKLKKRPIPKPFFRNRTGRSLARDFRKSNKSQVNLSIVLKDSQTESFFTVNSSRFR